MQIEVPDDATVDATSGGLELLDDPHGGNLRCPGQGASRETRHRHVDGVQAVNDLSGHRRLQVHDVGISPHVHELGDVDRSGHADPAQVVASQIDKHGVLGALLGVGQQLVLHGPVLGRSASARAGTGNGVSRRDTVCHRHQSLRGGSDDVESR